MYKIEHKHQHEAPVINGKEFDLETIGDFEEITAMEFGKSICRTTGSNAQTPVQYTNNVSWFEFTCDEVRNSISEQYEHQYHGQYWIWADGFILFALDSYYGTGTLFFKATICSHEFVEFQISRGYTRTECKKCNYSFTTDSTD